MRIYIFNFNTSDIYPYQKPSITLRALHSTKSPPRPTSGPVMIAAWWACLAMCAPPLLFLLTVRSIFTCGTPAQRRCCTLFLTIPSRWLCIQFDPGPSYPGPFIPRTLYTPDLVYPGPFIPRTFLPRTFYTPDLLYPGPFIPRIFYTPDLLYPGSSYPGI